MAHRLRRAPAAALVASLMWACTTSSPPASLAADAAEAPRDGGTEPVVRPDAGGACAATDGDGDGFGTGPMCPALDCDDRDPLVYPGAPEACNGLDEDCDRAIDEDLGEGACGRGACRRSAPFCEGGRPAVCTPGPPAATESCNNVDDDCDGTTDEDVAGAACGVGACARNATCVGGVMQPCAPGPASAEACNRLDDDCDGTLDEGFRARVFNGSYVALTGLHSGCSEGSERMGPNCNAAMHRSCAQMGCTTSGFGPVENSGDIAVYTCVVTAELSSVTLAELARSHPDCNGAPQRIGPACNAAIHRWCAARGHATGFGPVESGADALTVGCLSSEVATVIETTYSTLATHHGGCDGSAPGRRLGPDCNAAMHRFCASRGHTSGFGPLENVGDVALVACVSP